MPRLRLGMRPRRAQSSTVDFGIARSEATSLDVITSVRVSGRSVLGDETSTLVKPTARGWETAPETRLLSADAQVHVAAQPDEAALLDLVDRAQGLC